MEVTVIEIGRNASKFISANKRASVIPSLIGEAREIRLSNEPSSKLSNLRLTINDGNYFVGDLARESHHPRMMRTPSKTNEETKILFATGLYVTGYKPEHRLVTLVPVDLHTSDKKREFVEFLRGSYTINGVTLSVSDIDVVPEGVSSVFDCAISDDFKLKTMFNIPKVRVVDIGSRTVNYATFLKTSKPLSFFDKESGTLNYGCIHHQGDSKGFIRRLYDDLCHVWELDNEPVVLTGGGVLLLGDDLLHTFPNHIVPTDPVLSNALGAWKLVNLKYANSET